MIRYLTGLFLAGMLVLGPAAAEAQVRPGGPPRQAPQRQELERRLMQGLSRLMQEQLGLSQEELNALQRTMQSFRENRMALAMEQASLRHRLRDPALAEMSQEEAREILAGMVRVQEEELALYRKEQGALLEVLSPQELVQFYRIRDEWGQEIQRMRQRRGPGGGGMPGGPPGVSFPDAGGSVWPGALGSAWPLGGSGITPWPERGMGEEYSLP